MCQFTSLLTEHFDYLQKVSVYFGVWRKQGIEGNILSWGLFSVTWKIYMVVWFTSLCLMPSHSRGLLVWESKIMATSPFFMVLVLFLIILLFVQYPSNTMVRAQLDSKGPILTIKCGKDHCVVLKARHFSHLASFYSRPGFTKPHFTNLGFDTQGDEYG